MAGREKVAKSELSGTVDDFLSAKKLSKAIESGAGEGSGEFLSIIEFIDRFKLLPNGLYPVQRFIIKLYYNVPLDNKIKSIRVTDKFNRETLFLFTEVEYLQYLYDKGRCNIKAQDSKSRKELVLVIGRRSGKSEISAIIAAYEQYKLLKRGHPQAYYGMPSGAEIRVLCIANDKDQASIVYESMKGHIESVDYFKSSQANSTLSYLKFRTENDRKKYGSTVKSKATIISSFKSSIAKGLRGRGVICVILDEIAFFLDTGTSSAEKIYKAIVPSTAQFSPKDPQNRLNPIGPSDGRVILISSPDAKDGFFYRKYQQAMSGSRAADNTLVIQAPTWEVNPTISPEYYEVEYHKDPRAFMTEHGAEFSDRVRGWIEESRDLDECIDPDLRPQIRGAPREIHFAGLDLGLTNDGTSISLSKIAHGKVELAYHEIWYAGKSWKDSNPHLETPLTQYCLTLQHRKRLDFTEIADWILALSKKFYIHKGVFDQWTGIVFEQELHKRGLSQFEMRNFYAVDSSNAYQNFKMFMYNKQISLYDYPKYTSEISSDLESKRRSPLIAELLELQVTSVSKNIISVEAPNIQGKHDDQSDALVRSILLASEYIKDHPGILDQHSVQSSSPTSQNNTSSYYHYHRMRNAAHGSPNLRPPRVGRRRF